MGTVVAMIGGEGRRGGEVGWCVQRGRCKERGIAMAGTLRVRLPPRTVRPAHGGHDDHHVPLEGPTGVLEGVESARLSIEHIRATDVRKKDASLHDKSAK